MEKETEQIAIWVKQVFAPNLTEAEVEEHKDALTDYFTRTVDFLEYHGLPITLESITEYKEDILNWTGAPQEPACSCEQNTIEIQKLKKYGMIAIAILFLCIIFK